MKTFFHALWTWCFLRCRVGHPAWETLGKYRYAHRGYHDKPHIPENSMAAFRRAAERGWGAELDVHLMKDGTLAVIHDSSLKRTAGADVCIEDLSLADLDHYCLEGTDEKIPLFDEVLDLFEGKAPLIIELKVERGNHLALATAVCERLDSYKGDFCIESFSPFCVRDVKKLRPDICRGQLAANFLLDPKGSGVSSFSAFVGTHMLMNVFSKPDFIAYRFEHRHGGSPQVCKRYRKVQMVYWTIKNKADLLTCEAEGAIPIFEQFDPET